MTPLNGTPSSSYEGSFSGAHHCHQALLVPVIEHDNVNTMEKN